jgi:hypothetical protein
MVISPAMRGLFGIRVDAAHKTVWVDPQLPAAWDGAMVRNIRLGDGLADIQIRTAGCRGTCKPTLLHGPVGWKIASAAVYPDR